MMWMCCPQSYVDLCSFLSVRIRPILSNFEKGFPFLLFKEVNNRVGNYIRGGENLSIHLS